MCRVALVIQHLPYALDDRLEPNASAICERVFGPSLSPNLERELDDLALLAIHVDCSYFCHLFSVLLIPLGRTIR